MCPETTMNMRSFLPSAKKRRAMQRLLLDARTLVDPARDSDTEAYWVHEVATSAGRSIPAIQQAASRHLNRVIRDPARRSRWRDHMARWVQASSRMSPAAHFEAISGHKLEDFGRPEVSHSQNRPALRRVSRRRFSAASMLVAVMLVVGIQGMVSVLQPNPFAVQGTGVSGYAWEEVGLRVRGSEPESAAYPVATFHDAMTRARESRQSFFGFFVRYDEEMLVQAHTMMVQAIASAEQGYAVPPQAFDALQSMEDLLRSQNRDSADTP